MPEIRLDYQARGPFEAFHRRPQRWGVMVAHRRAGKTVACVMDLVDAALRLRLPHSRFAYVGPFLAQAKEIAWEYLKRFTLPIQVKKDESELWVQLVNGARIRIHGADNPDRLRGPYLDGVVLDEFADMRPGVWHEVVRPMLADRKGWATFIGTPKGKNAFWDLWSAALKSPDTWFTLMLKASQSGILSAEELASMRADMGRDEYEQEMECSFEAAIKGAFYSEELRDMEMNGRIRPIPIDRAIRVQTGWDLGRTDSTAIWFIQCVGRERRLVDYHEASGKGFPYYAGILQDKRAEHGWLYDKHWFPHDVGVHMMDSEFSRVETLRSLGIEPEMVPNHAKLDGINAVRRMLDRTWIDPERCARGLEALRQYRREWNDKLKTWSADPLHDWSSNGADALRTFAAGFDDPIGVTQTTDRHRRHREQPRSAWAV